MRGRNLETCIGAVISKTIHVSSAWKSGCVRVFVKLTKRHVETDSLFMRMPAPTFVDLAPMIERSWALPPRTPRSPRNPHLEKLARAPRTHTDGALHTFLTEHATPLPGSPLPHFVDDLTAMAASLSTGELERFRENITKLLEARSGSAVSAAAAVRQSRQFEATLSKASRSHKSPDKPLVSVRDLCTSFCAWPPSVQRHFFKAVLAIGGISSCMWDEEHDAVGAANPDKALVSGERLQPLGLATGLTLPSAPQSSRHSPPPRRSPPPQSSVERDSHPAGKRGAHGSPPPGGSRGALYDAALAAVGSGYTDAGLANLTAVLLKHMGCEHVICLRADPTGEPGQPLNIAGGYPKYLVGELTNSDELASSGPVRLHVAAVDGYVWQRIPSIGAIPPHEGCCGATVLESGEPLCLQRANADPRFQTGAVHALGLDPNKVRNVLSVPIPSPVAGRPILGIIELVNAAGSWGFEPRELTEVVGACKAVAPLLYRTRHLPAQTKEDVRKHNREAAEKVEAAENVAAVWQEAQEAKRDPIAAARSSLLDAKRTLREAQPTPPDPRAPPSTPAASLPQRPPPLERQLSSLPQRPAPLERQLSNLEQARAATKEADREKARKMALKRQAEYEAAAASDSNAD